MQHAEIGYNIHGTSGFNKNALFAHVNKLPPAPHVVLDQPRLALELQALTGRTVFHRRFEGLEHDNGATRTDDNIQDFVSPRHFVSFVEDIVKAGLGIYVNNEPRWDVKTLDWLEETAHLLVERKARAVLGNWSIGTPEPEDLHLGKKLIRFVQKHSDLLSIGLHEGYVNHWTNGAAGINHTNWQELDSETAILDYSGRFIRFYKAFGEFPIIMTEWTSDDLAETENGAPIHRIGPIWQRLYGRDDTQQFAAEQLLQAISKIYSRYEVPILMYCWGAAAPRWRDYDFSTAVEFQKALETANLVGYPKGEKPIVMEEFGVTAQSGVRIRAQATTDSEVVGVLRNGDTIQVEVNNGTPVITQAGGYKWMRVSKNGVVGYAASDYFTLGSSAKAQIDAAISILQGVSASFG